MREGPRTTAQFENMRIATSSEQCHEPCISFLLECRTVKFPMITMLPQLFEETLCLLIKECTLSHGTLPSLEQPYATQHIAQDTLSSEILLGNAACGLRLPLIIVCHRSDGCQRFVFRPESEETRTRGNDTAESCILRDHRTASGEITGAAIAEPATAQPDVLILGNGELAAGGTDVRTVSAGVRQAHRGHNAPTMAAHGGLLIVTHTANGQLKRQGRTRRQVDEMLKFEMLTPIVGFALPDNILASMLPVRDRGERRRRCRGSAGGPPIETDCGPCGLPLEPF